MTAYVSLFLYLFIFLSLYLSISLSQTIKYRDEIRILSWITFLMFQLWWVSLAPWPTSFRIYKSWWQSPSDSTSLPWYRSLWVWWKLWKLIVDQNITILNNACSTSWNSYDLNLHPESLIIHICPWFVYG